MIDWASTGKVNVVHQSGANAWFLYAQTDVPTPLPQIAGQQFHFVEIFFHELLLVDHITTPPPAWIFCPVNHRASSLTTKATTSAMSFGVPSRLSGEACSPV